MTETTFNYLDSPRGGSRDSVDGGGGGGGSVMEQYFQ